MHVQTVFYFGAIIHRFDVKIGSRSELSAPRRAATIAAPPRALTLRPEVVVWLDHVPIYLSRGRFHGIREDMCAAARSSIVHTSMLLTLTQAHSHGWPL